MFDEYREEAVRAASTFEADGHRGNVRQEVRSGILRLLGSPTASERTRTLTAPSAPLVPPTDFRGVFRDDAAACAVYSEAAGIGRIVPRAVAVPVDGDDVVAIVRWARARAVPITPRGSGTSMGGGAIGPGVIVDLSSLNEIGQVDSSTGDHCRARCVAGRCQRRGGKTRAAFPG